MMKRQKTEPLWLTILGWCGLVFICWLGWAMVYGPLQKWP